MHSVNFLYRLVSLLLPLLLGRLKRLVPTVGWWRDRKPSPCTCKTCINETYLENSPGPYKFLICTILCCESFRLFVCCFGFLEAPPGGKKYLFVCPRMQLTFLACHCVFFEFWVQVYLGQHTSRFFTFISKLKVKPNMFSGFCDVKKEKCSCFYWIFTAIEFPPSLPFLLILFHQIKVAQGSVWCRCSLSIVNKLVTRCSVERRCVHFWWLSHSQ